MPLKIPNHIVSVEWLHQNIENKNLIILDATLPKVTAKKEVEPTKKQIVGAIYFDLKNVFSDKKAEFPNTVLSSENFEREAQKLGINNNSIIVVYDDLGIYSSPRVWWLFKLMGFDTIAVLDGGFPEWKKNKYPIEEKKRHQPKKGNFKENFKPNKIKFTRDVLIAINNDNYLIADARSVGRFHGTEPEPRENVKSGHIPNSKNLPYTTLLENNKFRSLKEIQHVFKKLNPKKKNMIFSCGTGITACILMLGAALVNYDDTTVYDGSWTEWGSLEGLPIENPSLRD